MSLWRRRKNLVWSLPPPPAPTPRTLVLRSASGHVMLHLQQGWTRTVLGWKAGRPHISLWAEEYLFSSPRRASPSYLLTGPSPGRDLRAQGLHPAPGSSPDDACQREHAGAPSAGSSPSSLTPALSASHQRLLIPCIPGAPSPRQLT